MTPPLRAVLFDVGDTLVRLDAAAGALIARAARTLGADVEPEAAAAVWSRVLAEASTPEELAKGRDLSLDRHREVWTELYRRSGADELAPNLARAVYDATVRADGWTAFPDALGVLQALHRAGVPVGVVSDTGFDLRPVLRRTGLAPYVDTVLLSYEHGRCKPDVSVFRAACEALGVDPPSVLMVGDNPYTDGGAAPAGLTTLLLPPPTGGARGLAHVLRLLGLPA
ncbi:MAG TPA: HAD family hydrolase [Mycobacteriales bacterium]|nr:HAD family hydrolase [Mycobacteriales bacterium]